MNIIKTPISDWKTNVLLQDTGQNEKNRTWYKSAKNWLKIGKHLAAIRNQPNSGIV